MVWALLYAFTGNIGYFFFLVLGIQYAGATITTLIIGTLPIVISLVGNLLNKEFPFKIMLIPACAILFGIFLLYSSEQGNHNSTHIWKSDVLLGYLCCFIPLALWTWYGISNANFLKKDPPVSADLFSTIIDIQIFVLVLLVLLRGTSILPRLNTNLNLDFCTCQRLQMTSAVLARERDQLLSLDL